MCPSGMICYKNKFMESEINKYYFVKLMIPYWLLLIYSIRGFVLINTTDLTYWLLILTSLIIPIVIIISEKNKIYINTIFIIGIILIISFTTENILIWYISFEIILIPMILLLSKGSSSISSKYRAYYRFVIYTLISGFCLLINIIIIIIITGSLSYYSLIINSNISITIQIILFPINLISYLIKLPIIPFHIWLPDTHGEAPTSGSVILAALILKLGGIGILRWLIPIYPYGYFYYRPLIYLIGILSSIYASITTLRHIDIKKIIAYSSIAHMGLILIGLISLNEIGFNGIIYLLVSHGLVSSLLFLLIGALYIRTGTRNLLYYRGLNINMPIYSFFLFLSLLINGAFPPSLSFWSEFHIISGALLYELFGTCSLMLAVFISGVYSIILFTKLIFSINPLIHLNDLCFREFIILLPLLILSILLIFLI
jgi:proton-translocating NADH-quinone oxidoreductase chain M